MTPTRNPKRRKISPQSTDIRDIVKAATDTLNRFQPIERNRAPADDAELYCQLLANKLRRLSRPEFLMTQRAFNDILFELEMKEAVQHPEPQSPTLITQLDTIQESRQQTDLYQQSPPQLYPYSDNFENDAAIHAVEFVELQTPTFPTSHNPSTECTPQLSPPQQSLFQKSNQQQSTTKQNIIYQKRLRRKSMDTELPSEIQTPKLHTTQNLSTSSTPQHFHTTTTSTPPQQAPALKSTQKISTANLQHLQLTPLQRLQRRFLENELDSLR